MGEGMRLDDVESYAGISAVSARRRIEDVLDPCGDREVGLDVISFAEAQGVRAAAFRPRRV